MTNAVFRDGNIPGNPSPSAADEYEITSEYAMAILRWLIAIMDDDDPYLPQLFRYGAKFHAQGGSFTRRQIEAIIMIEDKIIDLAVAGKLDSQSKAGVGSVKFDLKSADMMGSC